MARQGLGKRSIPSMARQFSEMSGVSTEEKTLLVRLGTLIDTIIQNERGLNNVGKVTKKTLDTNAQKVEEGEVQNILRAAHVRFTNIDAPNLESYEVQLDTDSNFSNPTEKTVFQAEANFKGLTAGQAYSARVRPIFNSGIIGDFFDLGTVTIEEVLATADGTVLDEDAVSDTFTINNADDELYSNINTKEFQLLGTSISGADADDTRLQYRLLRDSVVEETITLNGLAPVERGSASESQIRVDRHRVPLLFTLLELDQGTDVFEFEESEGDPASFDKAREPAVWVSF